MTPDTQVKAIKSDSDSDSNEQKKVARFWEEIRDDAAELATKEKVARFFREKIVAAPGVTHPSDATGWFI